MLFAVHPINVETVAWISQRKGLLALLFSLLSILWYLHAEAEKNRNGVETIRGRFGTWYWLSVLAFAMAMLSKGSVAVLPALLLLILWWRRPLAKVDLIRTAPFWLIAIVLAGVNILFHSSGKIIRAASFPERLAGAARRCGSI